MTIALVAGQVKSTNPGTVLNGSLALTSTPTVGNFVIVGIYTAGNVDPQWLTFTDGAGHSYTKTASSTFFHTASPALGVSIFYIQVVSGVTGTFSWTRSTTMDTQCFMAEFSGVKTTASFEREIAHGATDATQSATINDPTITTTNDGDLLFAIIGAGANVTSANGSWALIDTIQNGNAAGYMVQGTHGAQAINFTQSSSAAGWGALVAAFIAAPSVVTFTLGNYTLDNGLSGLDAVCDKIYVCSQTPTTYTEAITTYGLGNKNWGAGNAFANPAAQSPNGRQITSIAITDGSITANGTVAAWAAVDTANSQLLATGSLTGGKVVTSGQTFTLTAMTFGIPNQ